MVISGVVQVRFCGVRVLRGAVKSRGVEFGDGEVR